MSLYFYQRLHLSVGFIGESIGQLKSSEKSFIFLNDPNTRNRLGECLSVAIASFRYGSRTVEHQLWAAETQNSCFLVNFLSKNGISGSVS